jgi:4-aminobutyrate aminotransferase-like enzyme
VSQPAALAPALVTAVPGPRSRELARRLRAVESRNVTCLEPEPPIFWARAAGANVWDVDGNRFLDLGGAFAVANVGHAHPRVVRAVAEQAGRLLHGMGDVHPPEVKVELLEALAARFPGGGPARAVLGSSGADAVEAALKTAQLATGRSGVLAFEGAYHGLSYGALDVTWRAEFRAPFAARLPGRTWFAPGRRRGAGGDRRDPGRADPGARRRAHPAAGLPGRAARALRRARLAVDRGRDLHRLRAHRPDVRVRA